ncbi:MAG: hypothetical protein K2O63_06535 [Alistipes sp.]|nr:hypothetical protein [Alistipes sp.]
MRRRLRDLCTGLLVAGAAAGIVFAGGRPMVPAGEAAAAGVTGQVAPSPAAGKEEPRKVAVDFTSDRGHTIPFGDTTAMCLVGHFAAQHNGTVITCDSAIRYSDMRFECFGNVLINKNTTYIYGDRAEYNGELNQALVHSDLVKVVDGEATLYTYNFVFNTLDNVGRFSDGGIVTNRDSHLESMRGYYYADSSRVVCVDRVQMRSENYELRGDSVLYDMNTDQAYFFDRTNIWNREGDYIYADRGRYEKARALYALTRSAYVLTDRQELWSDSLYYYRERGHARLYRNIQIDDTDHKVLAFGDYGEYWKEPGDALLTQRPSLVGYDTSQGDTLYMRADTVSLHTIVTPREEPDDSVGQEVPADSTLVRGAEAPLRDSLGRDAALQARRMRRDSLLARRSAEEGAAERGVDPRSGEMRPEAPAAPERDLRGGIRPVADVPHAGNRAAGQEEPMPQTDEADTTVRADASAALSPEADVPATDSLASFARELTPEEAKARADSVQAARKAAEVAARKQKLAEIARARQARATARLDAQKQREEMQERRMEEQRMRRAARAWARKRARVERAVARGRKPASALDALRADSLRIFAPDSVRDSVTTAASPRDTLRRDSLAPGVADGENAAVQTDSIRRIVKGYRRVKIYRSDFQAVCDSLVSVSTDSTVLLYIDPVMWNQQNQITSDQMKIYLRDAQIDRAEFEGSPLMTSRLDTMCYNQVAGKLITAYFRDNKIYRNDVDGNVQTLYYMQEDGASEPGSLLVLQAGSASYDIEDNAVVGITYRNQPEWHVYPMNMIPETQDRFLENFSWEGARRPLLREVFDRRIRPSERERKSGLAKPDFPITRRIEEYKRQLIQRGTWVDRDDRLTPDILEWMHELGY